jgi:hypothetical protein
MKLILQSSARVHEANLFSLVGPMKRPKVGSLPLAAPIDASPKRGGSAVSEKARANDHSRVIIEIKRRRAYLNGDGGDGRIRMRGEKAGCRVHGWQCRATAKSCQIVEVSIGPHANLLRKVTGNSRTEVTGASAHEEGIDLPGRQARRTAGLFQRSSPPASEHSVRTPC